MEPAKVAIAILSEVLWETMKKLQAGLEVSGLNCKST